MVASKSAHAGQNANNREGENSGNSALTRLGNQAGPAFDDPCDDEFASLFAAFDAVRASDDLKAATLQRIIAEPGSLSESPERSSAESLGGREGAILTEDRISTQDASGLEEGAGARSNERPRINVVATTGAASHRITGRQRRAKRRMMRVVALAACLALALSGGAAYALPASHVKLNQGSDSIDLGVNLFGMTVTAQAESAEDEPIPVQNLTHKPYEDALGRAIELLDERNSDEPINIAVEARDDGRRHEMEDAGQRALAERPEAPRGDAQPAGPADDQASGQAAEQPPSQPSAQPSAQPTDQQPSQQQPGQESETQDARPQQPGNSAASAAASPANPPSNLDGNDGHGPSAGGDPQSPDENGDFGNRGDGFDNRGGYIDDHPSAGGNA